MNLDNNEIALLFAAGLGALIGVVVPVLFFLLIGI
jgi:hypothetical protein